MKKLNIAGGEPYLYPKFLTNILRYYKEQLGLESVSIFSNGCLITRALLKEQAPRLDILAVSCDSFNATVNRKIGCGTDGRNVARLYQISKWCHEDMIAHIEVLAPFRWKVFQCLIVAGENEDETRKRDARKFLITDEQWNAFCNRHRRLECYILKDNKSMAGSYLFVDEDMCFLDKGENMLKKSRSILDVGVKRAMREVVWDTQSFLDRGGHQWKSQLPTDDPEPHLDNLIFLTNPRPTWSDDEDIVEYYQRLSFDFLNNTDQAPGNMWHMLKQFRWHADFHMGFVQTILSEEFVDIDRCELCKSHHGLFRWENIYPLFFSPKDGGVCISGTGTMLWIQVNMVTERNPFFITDENKASWATNMSQIIAELLPVKQWMREVKL
ncbi:hypothetical protein B0J11DRAFT_611447 [Dendryphion nanum]|uniref:Radical SAM core domain-containing protein n=1 Tax=Dendryphion nanum TaxID=256645 RepID=A0A9P9ED95_9PLEO|nr:hypothetical protein B0J11DRAFT_611447 [Dendryphion nanum]